MIAACEGYTELVKILVGYEACIQDNNGTTALHHAAWHNRIDCVLLLVKEAKIQNNADETALIFAAQCG